jgi:hypothetical protein
MKPSAGPAIAVWDTTYACPLLCLHCYSESGRRPSRQLKHDDMLRVADKIIEIGPQWTILSGGEPLLVRGIVEIARRISSAGIKVAIYTGGWSISRELAEQLAATVDLLGVSVDGATPEVHDRIRGRVGSFDRVMRSLAVLDDLPGLNFGIDTSVLRGNLDRLDDICTTVVPRFPHLRFAWFGPAVQSGAASRAGFAEAELLTEEQRSELCTARRRDQLQSLTGAGVDVQINDNHKLMMYPGEATDWSTYDAVQIEPDGAVRAMSIYEGTVGNILIDPIPVLLDRVVARWHDPFVTETLRPARTMIEWAAATRAIDQHFGTADDLARFALRTQYRP